MLTATVGFASKYFGFKEGMNASIAADIAIGVALAIIAVLASQHIGSLRARKTITWMIGLARKLSGLNDRK